MLYELRRYLWTKGRAQCNRAKENGSAFQPGMPESKLLQKLLSAMFFR